MSMILLAVEDADRDAPIRDLLTAEGYWVTTTNSHEETVRAAADHAPSLLIVDAQLGRANGLLESFRRSETGPAVLLLVDGEEAAVEGEPATIVRGQDSQGILATVRESLEAPREMAAGPDPVADEQLTTSDLFGDILAGLGEEHAEAEQAEALAEEAAEKDAEPQEEAEPEGESDESAVAEEEPPAEAEVPAERVADPVDAAIEVEAEVEAAAEAERGPEDDVAAPVDAPEFDTETEPAAVDSDAGSTLDEEVSELVESGDRHLEEEDEGSDAASALEIERQVEDLLAGEHEDWQEEGVEDTDSLSIHEVLGSDENVAGVVEAQPEAEEAEAAEEIDEEPFAEPADLEVLGGYELLELVEFTDHTERWKVRRVGDDSPNGLLERLRTEVRGKTGLLEGFVNGYSEAATWEDESLLRVLDLGRDGDVDFVVTELLEGHSLQELVHRVRRMEGRMPLGVALLIAERIARGLSVIEGHSKSSHHGRLVPSSVWVGKGGRIVLRDFGSRRSIDDEVPALSDWEAWRFIAPEAWDGKGDIRSDFYSLGAIVYEMVTGRPIHAVDDLEALGEKVRGAKITAAQEVDPTIPSEIDDWIMALLDSKPKQRPQSAAKVTRKIDRSLESLPARPGDAELSAYLRQLFAARVPSAHKDRLPLPDDFPSVAARAPELGHEGEQSGLDPKWWWLIAILLGFIAGYLLLITLVDGSASSDLGAPSAKPLAVAEAAVARPPGRA